MLGGFRARADEVRKALRGPDVAYVLVTSPDPLSIREIQFFAERLRELSMPRDARGRQPGCTRRTENGPTAEAVRAELEERGSTAGRATAKCASCAHSTMKLGRVTSIGAISARWQILENGEERPIRVEVPALVGDVHDLRALAKVAAALAPL